MYYNMLFIINQFTVGIVIGFLALCQIWIKIVSKPNNQLLWFIGSIFR